MFLKRISFIFFFLFITRVSAQSDVGVISGGAGFVATGFFGSKFYSPQIAPVILIPSGDKWLIEARGTVGELIFQENGNGGPFHSATFTSVDFLQLDYIANSHLTISAGYFLTPFNICNERLSPIWITELRSKALADSVECRTPVERRALFRMRSRAIRVYVSLRAKGKCEGCAASAPFVTQEGRPYLEPHHIRR